MGGRVRQTRSRRNDHLYELAGRITERDRTICRLLFDHRVLTTGQVADVGFTSLRKAQERLAMLCAFDVVDRFRPRSWSGSRPNHFTLGPAGTAVIAAERGVDLADLKWRRETGTALASNSHLVHLVGCNGFFTALLRSARMRGDAELAEWWSARRCAAAWAEAVRPDGYAVWVEGGWRRPFLFEFDLASERLAQLEAKLEGYALLFRSVGHPTWVLFSFPTRGRETAARRVLAHPAVPVATAVLPAGQSADGPVWMAVGESGPRRRLADLGHPERFLSSIS